MSSQELKIATINYLLFRRNFLGAFTESFNAADVLGVSRKFISWEFEIKVSKEDLAKELKAIRFITGEDTNLRRARAANKTSKHKSYLDPFYKKSVPDGFFIPNYFSFVVPEEIAEYVARGVAGTPYGVYLVNAAGLYSKVTPKQIHDSQITENNLHLLVRKACTENLGLREKLLDLTK